MIKNSRYTAIFHNLDWLAYGLAIFIAGASLGNKIVFHTILRIGPLRRAGADILLARGGPSRRMGIFIASASLGNK